MTDPIQAEVDRLTDEISAVRESARAARAGVEAGLRARLADLEADARVQRNKVAELEARLRSLYVRNAELRRALLQLE